LQNDLQDWVRDTEVTDCAASPSGALF